MHHLVYLLLELLCLSTCVIAAPRSLPGSTGADQGIEAIAEEAVSLFVSRTVIRSIVPENLTAEGTMATGHATLLASSPNAAETPYCFNPRPQPPTFKCIEALHGFLRSFDQTKTYVIKRHSFPSFPGSLPYRVPRFFIAGTCRLGIDVDHAVFIAAGVEGRMLKMWSSRLVNTCVSNERYSGGGLIAIRFGRRGGDLVNLNISISPTGVGTGNPGLTRR